MSMSLRSAVRLPLAAVLLTLVLSGCTGGVAARAPTREVATTPTVVRRTPTPTLTPRPVQPRTLRLVAEAHQQPFAAAIAEVLAARVPGLKVALSTSAGAGDTLRQLDAGRADLALVYDDVAMLASNKEGPFTDRAIQVAALAAVYREIVQVIVGADTDIQNARGLVGKKVSLPPGDTHAADLVGLVLRGGGFTSGDLAASRLVDAEAAAALRERRVDAALTAAPAPLAVFQQAAEQRPVRLVPIDGAWRDLARQRYRYFVDATVPPGVYRGQDAPVASVGVAVLLAARRNLPEQLAYDLARGLVEGKDDVVARYPAGVPFVPREFTRGVNTPFHPAAVQYYDEQGLVN